VKLRAAVSLIAFAFKGNEIVEVAPFLAKFQLFLDQHERVAR
jgi:hypothetical protein